MIACGAQVRFAKGERSGICLQWRGHAGPHRCIHKERSWRHPFTVRLIVVEWNDAGKIVTSQEIRG